MKTLQFRNGDQMPAIGLGTWKSAPGEVYDAIRKALKHGYRHFDCAAIYQNEAEIGQAFKDAFEAGEVERADLWITSKLWNNAHLTGDVIPALQKTLSDLQLEYLDLYLIHWPVAHQPNVMLPRERNGFLTLEEAPIADTWTQMEQAVDQGLTRHIGMSNFNISSLQDILNIARIKPEMNQVEMHPFLPQNKLKDFCAKHQILMTAYSPLGSLDRDARMKKADEPSLLNHEVILEVAKNNRCTPGQVLIAYHLHRELAVIPKSTNDQRLLENLQSADVVFSDADWEALTQITESYRFIDGSIWAGPQSPYALTDIWEY